mmetsp:Transcript_16925/g.16591  ORF Transcript_16925/g.16591 Transcript_16925/m.16591 type:complete len:301 (-) Transcript_16925:21-923(-)
MYKSAYGVAFGRKETDLADTGILSFKKFSELQACKILNKTAKAHLDLWVQAGEDKKYISLAIIVVKGIFTHWKQSLPAETMSHIKHAWYDPHDVVQNQTIQKANKSTLVNRIAKATSNQRPQTTSNLLKRRMKNNLIPTKLEKKDQGMDGVIRERKKFLLRGNGNITGFYNDPSGMVSSYQNNFKSIRNTTVVQRTAGNMYTSSIMVVTPDPGQFAKAGKKQEKFKKDLCSTTKKLKRTESALQKAMGRAMGYNRHPHLQPMRSNLALRIDGDTFMTPTKGFPSKTPGTMNPYRHLQTSG